MKAFKTLLLLGMVVFVSCGDDEDKLLADEILGRWNFSLFTTTNCGNNSIGNVSLSPDANGCVTIDGDTSCDVYLVFNADGTALESYTFDGYQETDSYTYTVDEANDVVTLCDGFGDCQQITLDDDMITRDLADADCEITVEYTRG